MERHIFPFCAIVGQDRMKKALLLNVINPAIGGVLIRGDKGTAKSTAVRALPDLLPLREVSKSCGFHCPLEDDAWYCDDCKAESAASGTLAAVTRSMRVVDLPLSATEDRVSGSLNIEYTLKTGEKRFEPGILAEANGNILYVDEVNLLEDHLVDLLLDAAAMGINIVEREGISYAHPSRFILVGTMNPEEGDLRPQLLDRFGLVVDVRGEENLPDRVEVVRRRMAFETDPEAFIASYEKEQRALSRALTQARTLVGSVTIPDERIDETARVCLACGVDGHRADITIIKAAAALCALEGGGTVEKRHCVESASLALPHRMRRKPFEEGTLSIEEVGDLFSEKAG